MSPTARLRATPVRHPRRGLALMVTLVLVVIVAIAAAASMRSVAQETRMTATSIDRNLMHQSAEAALRAAETETVGTRPPDYPSAGCTAGKCAAVANDATARWADSSFGGWQPSTVSVAAGSPTPETIIEQNGEGENWAGCGQDAIRSPNCMTPRYRVTSRATAEGRATVILQADVATP
ncbi:MAG: hypothetical protein MUF08_06695 [Burkholderiaceae bacterium]|nr:hypothetical protein [Burkholderiaceae bacterium]